MDANHPGGIGLVDVKLFSLRKCLGGTEADPSFTVAWGPRLFRACWDGGRKFPRSLSLICHQPFR